AIRAGLDVDKFAPRLSFFFNAHSNFLEEVAKYRAARRMWAKIMRDRFKAKSRFHADRAATRKQHRPHRHPGHGCRARRHAVSAHERLRRGAGAADRSLRPN